MRRYLLLAFLVMLLYIVGSILAEEKLGFAVAIGYILFLVTRGAISNATGYMIGYGIYVVAAIIVLAFALYLDREK